MGQLLAKCFHFTIQWCSKLNTLLQVPNLQYTLNVYIVCFYLFDCERKFSIQSEQLSHPKDCIRDVWHTDTKCVIFDTKQTLCIVYIVLWYDLLASFHRFILFSSIFFSLKEPEHQHWFVLFTQCFNSDFLASFPSSTLWR